MTATLETGTLPPFPVNPDEPFQGEWARFEQDPGPLVVLLGCQRSGTTLLHLQLLLLHVLQLLDGGLLRVHRAKGNQDGSRTGQSPV